MTPEQHEAEATHRHTHLVRFLGTVAFSEAGHGHFGDAGLFQDAADAINSLHDELAALKRLMDGGGQ